MNLSAETHLYIVVTDECNFTCQHCCNQSAPKTNPRVILRDEINAIAQFINSQPGVPMVNFTGGEPTLALGAIEDIQEKVTRGVKFAMTTNGWFGKERNFAVFDHIRLDRLFLSYDRFHAQFIDKAAINAVIGEARRRGIEVTLRCNIDQIEDLTQLEGIDVAHIQSSIGLVSYTGRARMSGSYPKHIGAKDVLGQSCPSLDEEGRIRSLMFIPGKGITFCCRPFDSLQDQMPAEIVVPLGVSPETIPLLGRLQSGDFASQLQSMGLKNPVCDLRSPCDLCSLLYLAPCDDEYAIGELLAKRQISPYIPLTRPLNPLSTSLLSKNFSAKYTLAGSACTNTFDPECNLDPGITITQEAPPREILREFLRRTYYQPLRTHFDEGLVNESETALLDRLPDLSFRRFYFHNQKLVAIYAAFYLEPHPQLKRDTFHIGFVAQDRDRLTVAQSHAIKNDWLRLTRENNLRNLDLSCAIYCFNQPSIRFFTSIGLSIKGMNLSEKNHAN